MTTILVVDDTSIFRAIMKRYLNKLGFDVLELDSGKGVAKLLKIHQIEAIILDIIMDEQEGIETILELRNMPNRPKIIAVSSNEDYLQFAWDFGANATLTKPVALDNLTGVLRNLAILP